MPHEYAQWQKAGETIRKVVDLEAQFQAWYGVALNEEITGEGGRVHKDVKNNGLNCAVPWGEFTRGYVMFIEL